MDLKFNKMNIEELNKIIRETLSEIDLKENITYYVCDGCPTSGDTFADDPTCGGGCSGGCTCTEANTGMTTGGGPGIAGGDRNRGRRTVKTRKPNQDNFMKENKTIKNKKTMLNERFQELAGIKPLYEEENEGLKIDNSNPEKIKEELMNEGPELWTALGGLVGLIGAAGITTQLQMMAEDPVIAEKYPKLEKIFTFLAKVGGAVGKGIK